MASSKSDEAAPAKKISTRDWSYKGKFYCRPANMYAAFTDPRDVTRYTRYKAEIDAVEDGKFSWLEGAISGKFVTLVKDKKIVERWRMNTWPEGHTSEVTIEFTEEEEGETIVTLTQKGIPVEDAYGNRRSFESTTEGWRNRVFKAIQTGLGYGFEEED